MSAGSELCQYDKQLYFQWISTTIIMMDDNKRDVAFTNDCAWKMTVLLRGILCTVPVYGKQKYTGTDKMR